MIKASKKGVFAVMSRLIETIITEFEENGRFEDFIISGHKISIANSNLKDNILFLVLSEYVAKKDILSFNYIRYKGIDYPCKVIGELGSCGNKVKYVKGLYNTFLVELFL